MIYGLIITSLIVRNGQLMSLALPFLIYLLIGIQKVPGNIALSATRIIDKPSFSAREPIQEHIVIENQGSDLDNLWLEDPLLPTAKLIKGHSRQGLSISSGKKFEMSYVFSATRGEYRMDTIHACATDPFGLFYIERDIPAYGEILVRPELMNFRKHPFKPLNTVHITGQIPSRISGSGLDFLGLREYRHGDPLQHINWHLAARRPHQLFTNEYEREEIADFGLILDTRKISSFDAMEEEMFEQSISAATSLSEKFIVEGNRVALLVFGKNMTSIFPGYGKRHFHRVLRSLSSARMSSNIPFGYLRYIPSRLFPSRSIIIIFSCVDSQDIDVYIFLTTGVYLYNPKENQLDLKVSGDHRHLIATTQAFVNDSKQIILLVSDISRFKKGEESEKLGWAAIDAGIVAQNIMIFCASEGFLARPRVFMEKEKIRQVLNLTKDQHPILNIPVSYRK